MTQSAYLPPQLNPDSPVLQKLRKLLLKAGYCDAGVSPTFENPAPTIPTDIPSGSALYTLLRLFFDRDAVSTELFEAALHPLSLEQLLSVGFCRMEGNQVVSNVLLQPYEDQLFAMGEITLPPRPEDNIMRISKASFELAHLITPRHARNALDLGTGCGFLATLLSPQADRVYALDLNSAAIQFAEFNARWNSFRNI